RTRGPGGGDASRTPGRRWEPPNPTLPPPAGKGLRADAPRFAARPSRRRFGPMTQPDVLITAACRTPVGRAGRALAGVRPDDLAALVLGEAARRGGRAPASLDDVILGCAGQAGEDSRNVARIAALLAGFPVEVPGQTVNR